MKETKLIWLALVLLAAMTVPAWAAPEGLNAHVSLDAFSRRGVEDSNAQLSSSQGELEKLFERGKKLYEGEQYKQALDVFLEVVRRKPTWAEAQYYLGE